jgi:uncharacterized membrane protein YgdD (TMEM256/DUF423 family)
MNAKACLIVGVSFGLLSVVLGAFGAHWLKSALPSWGLEPAEQLRRLENWEVAVRYQMYHALALIAVGLFALQYPTRSLQISGAAFTIGVLIFSGCLYGYVFTGMKTFGMIVPLGGLAQIAGWVALLISVCRLR